MCRAPNTLKVPPYASFSPAEPAIQMWSHSTGNPRIPSPWRGYQHSHNSAPTFTLTENGAALKTKGWGGGGAAACSAERKCARPINMLLFEH